MHHIPARTGEVMSQTLHQSQSQTQQATPNFYSVVVNLEGGKVRASNGAIQTTRVGTGEYSVTFPEDIDTWAWLASLGAADDSDQVSGSVTTELGAMGAKAVVRVRTFNIVQNAAAVTVTSADRPFHLYVRRLSS